MAPLIMWSLTATTSWHSDAGWGGVHSIKSGHSTAAQKWIGKMIIGTVKGDIHYIGKNLVAMMMEGACFQVERDTGAAHLSDPPIVPCSRSVPPRRTLPLNLTHTGDERKIVWRSSGHAEGGP